MRDDSLQLQKSKKPVVDSVSVVVEAAAGQRDSSEMFLLFLR